MDSLNSVARGKDRILCANGCGFYGNDSTLGFCSKCYRDHIFASHANVAINNNTTQQLTSILSSKNKSGDIESKVSVSSPTKSKNKTKQRCSKCERKVGLAMAALKCRCNGIFCAAHRLPEEHDCTFDYRITGRLLIEDANPLIKAKKVNKM